ncbi:MAG: ComF family protein [Anaerolineales bacterium]|nr:ComF family protein [Anaerolineales bacterium]
MIRRYSAIERRTRTFFSFLLDLVFPPRCVSCRTLGRRICEPCAADISWIESNFCPQCGLPLDGQKNHTCIDPACLGFVRSAAVFSGTVRKALHALKYYSDRTLAEQLVRRAHSHWNPPSWDFDTLVPVPLGRKRERRRGYNQSLLLAEALSCLVGIPVDSRSLTRVRETQSQVGLSIQARKENTADAFRASGVRLRKVLLVDDVCTTGATLQSCAEALIQAGSTRVGALTIARAVLPAARQELN